MGFLSEEQLEALMKHYRPKLRNARQEVIGELVADFQLQRAE